MRKIELSNNSGNISGSILFPDSVVYVFNPNYVELNLDTYRGKLVLSVTGETVNYDIDVMLFKGKARCYISRLMQLLFTNYIATRSMEQTITVKMQDGSTLATVKVLALWAAVEHGMKFGYYLPFDYDRNQKPSHIREVIWFKNLPFRVSLFRISKSYNAYGKSDNNAIKMIYSGGELVWNNTKKDSAQMVQTINGVTTPTSSSMRLDSGHLAEAGFVVNTEKSGITDNSELNIASGTSQSASIMSNVIYKEKAPEFFFNYDELINSGLDIISYVSLYSGKYGIFELMPSSMFPNTKKQLVYTIMQDIPENAKFDTKFDIKFGEITNFAYIVRLTVCEDTEGIYLRWIDQYGFWQYYLFIKGTRTSKNTISKIAIDAEYSKDGIYFEAKRNNHLDNTDTQKCCAVNMRKEILAYVETIYKSAHVEMYLGKDINGSEMWKPVNIVADKVDIKTDNQLFDYEISFTMPSTISQTL